MMKKYPIDNREIHNKRKWNGAFVWHGGMIKRITNNTVGNGYCILNFSTKVRINEVKLAKIGDEVQFKDLSVLPDRCAHGKPMNITKFIANGGIGTNVDKHEFDDTSFSHFKAVYYEPIPTKR